MFTDMHEGQLGNKQMQNHCRNVRGECTMKINSLDNQSKLQNSDTNNNIKVVSL